MAAHHRYVITCDQYIGNDVRCKESFTREFGPERPVTREDMARESRAAAVAAGWGVFPYDRCQAHMKQGERLNQRSFT
jgi:hypothetical protein